LYADGVHLQPFIDVNLIYLSFFPLVNNFHTLQKFKDGEIQ
jgi:hypothetical protein